jgi:hypothetical protein
VHGFGGCQGHAVLRSADAFDRVVSPQHCRESASIGTILSRFENLSFLLETNEDLPTFLRLIVSPVCEGTIGPMLVEQRPKLPGWTEMRADSADGWPFARLATSRSLAPALP